MLSIGRLAAGQENYYFDAVAKGREDYYVRGELPGRWAASSTGLLGLDGTVSPEDLRHVLADRDATTGTRLGTAANRKVPGFDLTFRAPKSVSVLYGLGTPEIARAVTTAHEASVDAALDYLERHAVWSRRGHNGVTQIRADGLIAAAFRHRTSRNGDPHLHTHVLIANSVRGHDGRWRTIDARHLWAHAKTAGYLYEAHLRHELSHHLGVAWGPVHNGIADIQGIPRHVLKAFSTRRAEIEQRMAERQEASPRAAMIAALDTRQAKKQPESTVQLRVRWHERAIQLGYHPDRLIELIAGVRQAPGVRPEITPEIAPNTRSQVMAMMLGPSGLTAHRSSFDRRDVLRAWCDHLPAGLPVETIESLADELLTHPELVQLDPAGSQQLMRSSSGRVLSAVPTGSRWTPRELLAIEDAALQTARRRADEPAGIVDHDALAAAMTAYPTLSDEQAHAVAELTVRGGGITVLAAPAGTGKTFTLAAARQAWDHAGYTVHGAALAGIAANRLQRDADIPAVTITRFLRYLAEHPDRLNAGSVVVVDEAAMVGTRALATIIDHTARSNSKLVLVGDAHQLPEIEAGGLFATLADQLGAITLAENRRQEHGWERAALAELRDGDTDAALAAYREHGAIVTPGPQSDPRAVAIAVWQTKLLDSPDTVIYTDRRAEARALNRIAQQHVASCGLLDGPQLWRGDDVFQRGDHIVVLRNDYWLDIRNGQRGRITTIDPNQRTITASIEDHAVILPADYIDAGHVDLGYAVTIHKGQGSTCDHSITVATDTLYRELAYTALSRGRRTNTIIAAEPEPDDPEATNHGHTVPEVGATLERALATSRRQQLASQQLAVPQLIDLPTSALVAERNRLRRVADRTPGDRAAQIAQLQLDSEAVAAQIRSAEAAIADLFDGSPSRRARKRHRPELDEADHGLARLRERAHLVQDNLSAALEGQHARTDYLTENATDLDRLDSIEPLIMRRIDEAVVKAVRRPPAYVLDTLSARPGSAYPDDDKRWIVDVRRIETYRLEHDVSDPVHALGPRPLEPIDLLDWMAVDAQLPSLAPTNQIGLFDLGL